MDLPDLARRLVPYARAAGKRAIGVPARWMIGPFWPLIIRLVLELLAGLLTRGELSDPDVRSALGRVGVAEYHPASRAALDGPAMDPRPEDDAYYPH